MQKKYPFILVFLCLSITFLRSQIQEVTIDLSIDYSKTTIRTRIAPPSGFYWEEYSPNSFAHYLSNFKLKPAGFPIRDYKNMPLPKQYHHLAVLDIDVGIRDLQQCADAWMRLYGEYLWEQKRYDEIEFEFTSQQKISWNDFKKGWRTTEVGDSVRFHHSARLDDSYMNFRKYMDLIFRYSGTISLDRETMPVVKNSDIQVGDMIIKAGSPGHIVFVVGTAKNRIGKRVFLLAESAMPAQDIHILKNPLNEKLSPWYELDVNAKQLITPKYLFKPVSIKRYRNIK